MNSKRCIPNWSCGWICLTIFLISPFLCDGTLSKSNPKKAKQTTSSSTSTPTPPSPPTQTVLERGLVKEKFKIKDLIAHHSDVCKSCAKTRQFTTGASLAYVTPWNNRGYDVAKDSAKKFTHVSPVWLQLKVIKGLHLEVTGTHDVDANWIKTLKRRNKNIKIVPRMLLDNWQGQDYVRVFSSEDAMASVAKFVVDFLNKDDLFDGVVLETPWLGPKHRPDLVHTLVHIGDAVRDAGKQFILVIPPATPDGEASTFGAQEFRDLSESVDYFSLMTYDHPVRPGPNAPIEWVRSCVRAIVGDNDVDDREEVMARRRKLMVGLNFYGYNYGFNAGPNGVDAVVGEQLIGKLKDGGDKFKIGWNRDAMEHKFSAKGEEIYYPTLFSIHKRLELFKELGTSLSIWEIGQGLDYFYELM